MSHTLSHLKGITCPPRRRDRWRALALAVASFSVFGCGWIGVVDEEASTVAEVRLGPPTQIEVKPEDPSLSGSFAGSSSLDPETGDTATGGSNAEDTATGGANGEGSFDDGAGATTASGGSEFGTGGSGSGATDGGDDKLPPSPVWREWNTCAPDCEDAEILFEEDFERVAFVDDVVTDNGQVYLTPNRAHTGQDALAVYFGGGYSQSWIKKELDVSSGEELHFRGWLWVPKGTVTSTVSIVDFAAHHGDVVDFNLESEKATNVFAFLSEEVHHSEPGVYREAAWICVQASAFISKTEGRATLAIDGAIVARVDNVDTYGQNGINMVRFGMPWAEPGQQAGYLYWDDVVISDRLLPCR
ncbi:MAG: hypothetical protein MK135_00450 [Polyangiaceae bacterium]|nr:hypothetical protein [Polyangiaceae bacterium]